MLFRSNPHCEYCSNIHAQIDLLLKYKNIYQINYIFSSFSENLESSTKALIAAYFQYDNDYCKIIYNEWFSSGIYNPISFILKYNLDIAAKNVIDEFLNHKNILNEINLPYTPIVLIDGHIIPSYYEIKDLIYFSNINHK